MIKFDYYAIFKNLVDEGKIENTREEFRKICLRHNSIPRNSATLFPKAAISQFLLGKDGSQIKADRKDARKFLASCGFNVIDRVLSTEFEGYDPMGRLSVCVDTLAIVDLVYFLPGFESSRDCFIEFSICAYHGIPIYYDDRHLAVGTKVDQTFNFRGIDNTYHTMRVAD
jgi:hypothetical protein